MSDTISQIISNEKKRLEEKKDQVDSNLETQSRLMLLHDSQRKRTMRYTAIMAYLVFGALAYFLIDFVASMFPFIPSMLFTVLKFVVIGATVYMILTAYADITKRSTGNFDEIDVPPIIDISGNGVSLNLTSTEASQTNAGNFGQLFGNQCYGEKCCGNGTKWNEATQSCVKETFTTIGESDSYLGVSLNSIKSNLDGVSGDFVSSGDKYILPELINVSVGNIA